MRVAFLLLPLAQGTILSLSASSYPMGAPFELDVVNPTTGQFTKIADLASDGSPTCSTLRNDNTLVYGKLFSPSIQSSLVTMDVATGKVIQETPSALAYNTIEFDKVTSQTFVTAYDKTTDRNSLFELLPNQTLRKRMGDIPSVFFGVSAYSSSEQLLFLATEGGKPNVNSVLVLGLKQERIVYNVSVPFRITDLVYDDKFGVLYAWGFDSAQRAIFVSLDYTTGQILKTFIQSTSLFDGRACIDDAGATVYSSLLVRPSNTSVIHTLDLSSGKASQVATTGRFAVTMSFQ